MPEEPERHTDEYWQEPRTVEQVGCAACGDDHEMDYYPSEHPPEVGAVDIGVYHNPDARILAAGVCPNTETLVFVYSEGFELSAGFTDEETCDCQDSMESKFDERFCGTCGAVLPEYADQFRNLSEEDPDA